MQSSLERAGIGVVPSGIAAVLQYTVLRGLGVDAVTAWIVALTSSAAFAFWFSGALPSAFRGILGRPTALTLLWVVVGLGAIGATARLSAFMVDGRRADQSVYAFDDFFVHHSCLSAHFQSARLQRAGESNVYERTHYEGPNGEPKYLGPFVIDVFIYPPPFLLFSRLGLALSEDFAVWRAVFFGVEAAITLAAILIVAVWVGGLAGQRALLLAPVVWLSLPVLLTLQIGNFQFVAIAGAVLAMIAIERGRDATGGAVLAALTLSKIFPGVLILLLLFQRRWRTLAWTAGSGAAFVALALAVLGQAPFAAMLSYNLPRLADGSALETQFKYPDAIAASHAVFGIVQKLSLLGVPGMSTGTGIAVTWIYTAVLVGLVWLASRVPQDRYRRVIVWLALLHLASIRSPFTPEPYAQFPLLWMFVLVLAGLGGPAWKIAAVAGLVGLTNVVVPTVPILPVPALLLVTLTYQSLFLAMCVALLIAHARPAEAVAPASREVV